MPDTYTIPTIAANVGGATAVADINASFAAAETAINDLAARLELMNDKSAIVQHYVPIAADVSQGDLVYWDAENGVYERAQALLRAIPGRQGESIEAPCARVEGLIIQIDGSDSPHTATILLGGCYTNASVASNVLANVNTIAPVQDDNDDTDSTLQATTDWPSGVYYLSPISPGKVTDDPGSNLRQPVLVYHGGNRISLTLFYMAHDNHFHATETIDTWTAVGNTYQAVLPASFGAASTETAAVFMSGALNTTDFSFPVMSGAETQQTVVYSGSSAPSSGSVVVFNHFPFAYGSPVVRTVRTTNDSLNVEMANGIVTLTANAFVVGDTVNTGTAVGSISGGTITLTDVVTGVHGGEGITVTPGPVAGSVRISRSDLIGNPVEADLLNHNGTAMTPVGTSSVPMQCVTFIAGRTANVVLQKAITDVPNGTKAFVCGTLVGEGTDTLAVDIAFAPQPSISGAVATSSFTTLSPSTTMTLAGTSGGLTYAETSAGLSVAGTGVLMAKVAINSPPAANRCFLRLGFRLQ